MSRAKKESKQILLKLKEKEKKLHTHKTKIHTQNAPLYQRSQLLAHVAMHMVDIECAHKPLMPDFTDLAAVRNTAKAINVTPDFQGTWECGKEFGKFSYEDAFELLQITREHFL